MSGLWITLADRRRQHRGGTCSRPGAGAGAALRAAWLQVLARIYINFMRSIPLLVLLIIIYYALPFVGIRLSPFLSAVAALSLVSAAYTAEIFRAGHRGDPEGPVRGIRGARAVLPAHDGRRDPAAGDPHRHSAADQQLHQRHEGYRARLGRGDAGPSEAGDAGAGAGGQSQPADRRGDHLCRVPLAAGGRRVAAGTQLWQRRIADGRLHRDPQPAASASAPSPRCTASISRSPRARSSA